MHQIKINQQALLLLLHLQYLIFIDVLVGPVALLGSLDVVVDVLDVDVLHVDVGVA